MVRFDLAVPQSPVDGLQHEQGLHGGGHSPTDHPSALQIDPDSQVSAASCGSDVGDVTGPAAIGGYRADLLLQQVLRDSGGLAGAVAAWPESSAFFLL